MKIIEILKTEILLLIQSVIFLMQAGLLLWSVIETRKEKKERVIPVLVPEYAGGSGKEFEIDITNQGLGPAVKISCRLDNLSGKYTIYGVPCTLAPNTQKRIRCVLENPEQLTKLTKNDFISIEVKYIDVFNQEYRSLISITADKNNLPESLKVYRGKKQII